MDKINKDLFLLDSQSSDGEHSTAVLKSPKTLYVDVDRTLVFFPGEPGAPSGPVVSFKGFGITHDLIVHKTHVELLKQFKARGHGVVVWSQGGADWARQVVEFLNLTPYVDVVLSKPDWILDDKKATDWMGQRFYADPTTGKFTDFNDE